MSSSLIRSGYSTSLGQAPDAWPLPSGGTNPNVSCCVETHRVLIACPQPLQYLKQLLYLPPRAQPNDPQIWMLAHNRWQFVTDLIPAGDRPTDHVALVGENLVEGRLVVATPEGFVRHGAPHRADRDAPQDEWKGEIEPDEGVGTLKQEGLDVVVLPFGDPRGLGRQPVDVLLELGNLCPVRPVIHRVQLGVGDIQSLGNLACECALPGSRRPSDDDLLHPQSVTSGSSCLARAGTAL